MIPVAAPHRLHPDEAEAVRAATQAVLTAGPYVGGPAVSDFEATFADWHGVDHLAVGVGSGTDALILGLQALDLPDGAGVIVPPNDGGFAALACQTVGLAPIAADVSTLDAVIDVTAADAAWGTDVAALIVTHLHGVMADVLALRGWCDERSVVLIEDCAQAHGAVREGTRVGVLADVAAYSFYPTKNLGAWGDGGAVVTRQPEVAKRVRSSAQYGWGERHQIVTAGGRNSRLDPLQAAVVTAKLPFLARNNLARRRVIERYRQAAPGLHLIGDQSGGVAHHAVLHDRRAPQVAAALRCAGVATAVHYPHLVDDMPGIRLRRRTKLAAARSMQGAIVSLPCFPGIADSEVDRVAAALVEWAND